MTESCRTDVWPRFPGILLCCLMLALAISASALLVMVVLYDGIRILARASHVPLATPRTGLTGSGL